MPSHVRTGIRTRSSLVEEGVDVVDERGEQVAAASAEPSGHEGHDQLVDPGALLGQLPQGDVVGDQPLGVPQHRPGQAEGADADDRDQQQSARAGARRPG